MSRYIDKLGDGQDLDVTDCDSAKEIISQVMDKIGELEGKGKLINIAKII